MNKSELIAQVAKDTNLPKNQVGKVLDSVIESIQKALAEGDTVTLIGFGTFTTQERAARTGRNPRTGEPLSIPSTTVPKFKPGAGLRQRVDI